MGLSIFLIYIVIYKSNLLYTHTFILISASKLFGKRLLKTSRLVASTQVLTNSAIPTNDCDVVVTFPTYPDTNVLMWLLDRLRERTPDIIVHVRHHSNTKGPVLHLTATHNRYVISPKVLQ